MDRSRGSDSADVPLGLLRDRRVIVVASHGGYCGDAPAGQPDFLTPYLRTIFGTIGIREIHFLRLEGLSRGEEVVTRALDRASFVVTSLSLTLAGREAT